MAKKCAIISPPIKKANHGFNDGSCKLLNPEIATKYNHLHNENQNNQDSAN
jgi:hypothetical protein